MVVQSKHEHTQHRFPYEMHVCREERFGTHTVCSFQSLTSSAVSPASRISRLTRDTLPVDQSQDAGLYCKHYNTTITDFSEKIW